MTTQTLPDDPHYCFVPYDISDEVQQVRIVVDGMSGYIPTALVALTINDAERLCDRLNAKLGPLARGLDCARRTLHARRVERARRSHRALSPPPVGPASATLLKCPGTPNRNIGDRNGYLPADQGMGEEQLRMVRSARLLDCPLQGIGRTSAAQSLESHTRRSCGAMSSREEGRHYFGVSPPRHPRRRVTA